MGWAIINFAIGGLFFIAAVLCAIYWFIKTESRIKFIIFAIVVFTSIGIGFLVFGQYTLDLGRIIKAENAFYEFSDLLKTAENEIANNKKITSWLGPNARTVYKEHQFSTIGDINNIVEHEMLFDVVSTQGTPNRTISVEFSRDKKQPDIWRIKAVSSMSGGLKVNY